MTEFESLSYERLDKFIQRLNIQQELEKEKITENEAIEKLAELKNKNRG